MMLLTDELLLNYKRCRRRTYLDLYGNHQERDVTKEFILKLKRESQTHMAAVLAARSLTCHQPQVSARNWLLNSQETQALMQQGVDCINGGVLTLTLADWQSSLIKDPTPEQIECAGRGNLFPAQEGLSAPPEGAACKPREAQCFHIDVTDNNNLLFLASPTLLIKQPGISKWGDWLYIPVNIKLGRRPKQEYKFISAFHAQILAAIQGVFPPYSQLILRQHDDYFVNLEHWLPKMQATVTNCLQMLATDTEPEVFISRQKCSLCHWYSHCYTKAKSEQHLSLIPGVTPKRYEYLTTIGIESVESLAATCPINLGEEIGTQAAMELKQQALSLVDNRALLKYNYLRTAKTTIPTAAIELYFDIEAEPDRNLDYLLGVLLVDRRERIEKFYPLLAENPEEEGQIWQQFLTLVHSYPNAPIFHFSEYEIDTMKRLARLYGTPKSQIKSLLSRCVDLHYSITRSVILPVESYSLKSLANWIGFHWRDRGVSGDQCVCWYDGWINTRDRSYIEAILRYNEDDCRATFYLKDWLVEFLLYCDDYTHQQQIK